MATETYLAPERLYTLAGFRAATGLGDTTLRQARRQHGLNLPTVRVGRRDYVRGSDAIAYVLQLADLQSDGRPALQQPA